MLPVPPSDFELRQRVREREDINDSGMASSGINSQHCRHETTTAAREIITNRTVRHDIWAIPALICNCLCRRKSDRRRRSETGATPKHERNAAPLLRRKKALARSIAKHCLPHDETTATAAAADPEKHSTLQFPNAIHTNLFSMPHSLHYTQLANELACVLVRPPALTFSRQRGEGEERDKSIIPFPTSSLPPSLLPPSHPLLSYLQ